MLLVATQSAPSPIHGTGLFAAQFIRSGTPVWRFDPGVDLALPPEQLHTLSPDTVRRYLDWGYLDRHCGMYVLCGDDARYMNHSDNPSVVSDYSNDRFGIDIATRDIAEGEELSCNYHEFARDSILLLGESKTELPLADAQPVSAWINPGIETHRGLSGIGVFAKQKLAAGTLVTLMGGRPVDRHAWRALSVEDKQHSLQVAEQIYLAPNPERGIDDYFNHSCEPNLGIAGHRALVTLRVIDAGEELCFDYAMSDGNDDYAFTCVCGTANCRGRVTGNDWLISELQKRYRGHFAPYLTRRIHSLYAETVQLPATATGTR